jgi:hypothetical protein
MALRKATTLGVVHVTATPAGRDIGAKEIDAMHRALGWSAIGYNRVIRIDGRREMGRGYDEIGAGVAGFNSTTIHVVLVGGLGASGKPENTATQSQMDALLVEAREIEQRYAGIAFCGHRDLSPDRNGNGIIEPAEYIKACPCFDVIPWASGKGLKPADIKGTWGEVYDVPTVDGGVTKVTGPDARTVYLQKLLARTGLAFGPIDGIIGPKTAAAIKLYQEWNDLPQTGAFDEATVKLLRGTFEKAAA